MGVLSIKKEKRFYVISAVAANIVTALGLWCGIG